MKPKTTGLVWWLVWFCVFVTGLSMVMDTTRAGEGVFIELGVGNNTNLTGCSVCWDDGGGTGAHLAVGYTFPIRHNVSLDLHWSHFSQWEVGAPFNDKHESSVDHIGVKFRIYLDD